MVARDDGVMEQLLLDGCAKFSPYLGYGAAQPFLERSFRM
jgi:hypothetical protein